MKRTCNNCIALRQPELFHSFKCELGYEIEIYKLNKVRLGCKPLEECPKPTTYQAFQDALLEKVSKESNT